MARQTEQDVFNDVNRHFQMATQDSDTRRTRKNGLNDVIDQYMGRFKANWPYDSQVNDPRIRTTILEKTARLLNSKLKGRLVPREGGDVQGARINNSLLDFQWDQANEGGSMLEKVATMDQHTRMFGASFAMIYWKSVYRKGEAIFDGPELKVIDPRDILIDPSASHIRNTNWAQVREWTTVDKLEEKHKSASDSQWKNLPALKRMVKDGVSNKRNTRYSSQEKTNRTAQDRMGDDEIYPIIETVTELRKNRLIVFAPNYGLILKDIPNPYDFKQIPIVQLRYYPLGNELWGESEVEPVMPLARAINAILCGFLDEMNLKMRPPLKIASSGVRIETIEYGPGAKWIMNDPNNVVEMESRGEAIKNFNTSYSALVAAFNTAMGESSLGTSNVGRFQPDKTATEVNQLEAQSNSRDQYNQLYLEQMLKDLMMMWQSMNKQFLFRDKSMHTYILRIIGRDNIKAFQNMQMEGKDLPPEAEDELAQYVQTNPNVSDGELQTLVEELSIPGQPVIMNPNERNPENFEIKGKFELDDNGESGELIMTPEDMEGVYDYIPDVKSMAIGASDEQSRGLRTAVETMLNPAVQQMLMQEGSSVKIRELLIDMLEDAGTKDAESLFESAGASPTGGVPAPVEPNGVQGVPGVPQAVPAQPSPGGLPQPQGL